MDQAQQASHPIQWKVQTQHAVPPTPQKNSNSIYKVGRQQIRSAMNLNPAISSGKAISLMQEGRHANCRKMYMQQEKCKILWYFDALLVQNKQKTNKHLIKPTKLKKKLYCFLEQEIFTAQELHILELRIQTWQNCLLCRNVVIP